MQFLIDIGLILIYLFAFFMICAWSWRFWMMYINHKHLANINWLMLEIKLPREILKSPFATEMAISSLLQTGGVGDWYSKHWKGNLPVYSSLEIASIEGVIHFYIRIQSKYRTTVEANFYAQYPGIEIVEADDYTSKIYYDHHTKDVTMWGSSFSLGKTWEPMNEEEGDYYYEDEDKKKKYEMKADFLPIKTYVDYGLDGNPKEETKIDPIVPLLEFMGSVGKGEHVWYQILLQDESNYNGKKFPKFFVNEKNHKHVSLSDMADAYKKQQRIATYKKVGDKVENDYGEVLQKPDGEKGEDGKQKLIDVTYKKLKAIAKKEQDLTIEEKFDLEQVNKKVSKPLMCACIRLLYIADTKKGKFEFGHINDILGFSKPFKGANFLVPSPSDPYTFPWENFRGMRTPWRHEEFFESYVEREAFFPHIPDDNNWLQKTEDSTFWNSTMKNRKIFRMIYEAILHPFDHPKVGGVSVLNLEEIATLWHLPGQVAAVPTLPRIDSVTSNAPSNLPI